MTSCSLVKRNHVPKYRTSVLKVRMFSNLTISNFSQNIRNLQRENQGLNQTRRKKEATANSHFRGVLTIHSLHSVRRWRTSALIWNTQSTRHWSSCDQIICDVSVCYNAALGTAILTALYRSHTRPCGYSTLFSLASPGPEHCQHYDRRERPGATSGDHWNINHTINTAVFSDMP